jgi:phage N-6-adenine-methyltransferase
MNVHFSRKSDEWATPQELFDDLNEEFDFLIDVAATKENAKCSRFCPIEKSGLETPWMDRNWCNPPYSQLAKWIAKAADEQKKGRLTVMLIPARTDTAAFHDFIWKKPQVEVRFIRRRITFVGAVGEAPFASMVVIFRPIKN